MYGERAEVLAPMQTKDSQHVFHLSDAHLETYTTKDGAQGSKMSACVDDVELTDRRDAQQGQQPQQRPAPQGNPPQQRPTPKQAAPAGGGDEDMDSDIPF